MQQLWTCPECGRNFPNANQWNSCLVLTVDDHFKGRPAELRLLYDRIVEIIERNGPVIINRVKSRISFQVRMNFAAVHVRRDHLACHVVLRRRLEHPRFKKIEAFGNDAVHCFEVRSEDDLDDDVAAWFAESYRVGTQEE